MKKKLFAFVLAASLVLPVSAPVHAATPLYKTSISSIMQNARLSAQNAANNLKVHFTVRW